ncbi:MAG: hypothetical protein AMXMBFR34_31690 [Myxococcaceae bacterium]
MIAHGTQTRRRRPCAPAAACAATDTRVRCASTARAAALRASTCAAADVSATSRTTADVAATSAPTADASATSSTTTDVAATSGSTAEACVDVTTAPSSARVVHLGGSACAAGEDEDRREQGGTDRRLHDVQH